MTLLTHPFFMLRRLWICLFIKALVITGVIFFAGVELCPDEAQYWTWSQHLDWGYYSKPPGIAWQIWLGTKLFGSTEWGVRSVAVILSILQALMTYQLALKSGLQRYTALWCGLIMAFCPLGLIQSFLATTDGGYFLCWTGACWAVMSALQKEKAPDPLHVGGWILLGALFKWPIYYFWLFFFFFRYWYFREQKWSQLFSGIAISLLGLLPSVWWNWTHEWATFRHVLATIQGGGGSVAVGNPGGFLGAQFFLLSPILFVLLISGLWQWWRYRGQLSPQIFCCGFVTIVGLSVFILASFFQKIQGNWGIFIYSTGCIILGWSIFEKHQVQVRWVKASLVLSIILMASIFIAPTLDKLSTSYAIPYRFNPLKHNSGSVALQQALKKHGYQADKNFLVSDKYQTTSLLSFYAEGQKLAYFLNLKGTRKNQFSYWPALHEKEQNQIGYFVWIETMPYLKENWKIQQKFYQNTLPAYFDKIELLELVPLAYEGPVIAKAAFIFRCSACKNILPPDSKKY